MYTYIYIILYIYVNLLWDLDMYENGGIRLLRNMIINDQAFGYPIFRQTHISSGQNPPSENLKGRQSNMLPRRIVLGKAPRQEKHMKVQSAKAPRK